ncbi:MAG: signal peptide peptidase SppA [Myxococcota bacterium]
MIRLLVYPIRILGWWVAGLVRLVGRRKLQDTWLELALEGQVQSVPTGTPRLQVLLRRLLSRRDEPSVDLRQLERMAQRIQRRPEVRPKGLLVRLGALRVSWSEAEQLREVLHSVRDHGVPIVLFCGRAMDEKDAVIAAGASRVVVGPAGGFDATGTAARGLFLGNALSLLGIRVESISAGRFKSGPDALTRGQRSDADREQTEALVEALDRTLLKSLSASRGMTEEQVWSALEGGPYTATGAQTVQFVDAVRRDEDLPEYCQSIEGAAEPPSFAPADRWLGVQKKPRPKVFRPARLAIVKVHGPIIDRAPAWLSSEAAVQASVVDDIRRAGADPRIRGVLVHIDSRGGSVTASDAIYGALRRLARDKPVATVMGSVAASGGYYIAAAGDRIWASPRTLTGSIGVFGILPTWPELLNRLGIGHDAIHRLALANLMDPSSGLSALERERVQAKVDDLYELFVNLVADRRGKSRDEVHEVAQGRVWVGEAAKDVGLVDELGGVDAACAWLKDRLDRPVEPEPVLLRHRTGLPRPPSTNVPQALGRLNVLEVLPPVVREATLLTLMYGPDRCFAWSPLDHR